MFAESDKPRVIYVSLEAPVPGRGAYTHVYEIIEALRALGWEVMPVISDARTVSRGSAVLARLWDYFKVQAKAAGQLRGVDAVYLRGHFAAVPLLLLCRLLGKQTILEVNGTYRDLEVTYGSSRPVSTAIRWLDRCCYVLASHVVAVTELLAEWVRLESRHRRVSTSANGANLAHFRPEGPRFSAPRKYAIFVGGLVRWHGLDIMVEATKSEHWPADVDLRIIGDGHEMATLRELAAGNSRVVIEGFVPYLDVPERLRGAEVALVTITNPGKRSSTGVLPLKLYEAMACGVPVIVTRLPGQAEIVEEARSGLVIEMEQPEALARAVLTITSDPALRQAMGANGSRWAAEHGDWTDRAIELDRLFRQRIGAPGPD